MSTLTVQAHQLTIEPHPNADRLEIAKIGGYTSVVGKGQFLSGETALYIPEQAIVPAELLTEMGLEGKLAGSNHDRVKAARLRGVVSQGLVYAPPFPIEPNVDYAPQLGITKWEPPVPIEMAGKADPSPVTIPRMTEIENIKAFPNTISQGELVTVTEKIHGTCAIYHYEDGCLYVASKGVAKRGLHLLPDAKNLYWRVAREYDIEDYLASCARIFDNKSVTLYGEIYGVQDLKYGKSKGAVGFVAFDLRINGNPVSVSVFKAYVSLPTVPIIAENIPYDYSTIQELTSGAEQLTGNELHIREGVVVRPDLEWTDEAGQRVIFKSISDEYLFRGGEQTEYE